MTEESLNATIGRLLDRLAVVTHPCHLDLLMFFHRHPRTLIGTDALANYVGYDPAEISLSLEALVGSDLVSRSNNRAHSARMYVLRLHAESGDWLPTLLAIASTSRGRARVIAVLDTRTSQEPRATQTRSSRSERRMRVRHA